MAHPADLVDELANELATWPGVRIVNAGPDDARVFSERIEFGILHRDTGVAELRFSHPEHEELVEDAERSRAIPIPPRTRSATPSAGLRTSPLCWSPPISALATSAARTGPPPPR